MLTLLVAAAAPAAAISGNEQVRLAGEGRFDELARRLTDENAGPAMSTADRHAQCFAFSKIKDYRQLEACLDALEAGVRRGDRRTRLFGFDDATPAVMLMRAEAAIDLGDYDAAIVATGRATTWLTDTRSDDRDVEIQALSMTAIAHALAGRPAEAEAAYDRLGKVDVSWPQYNSHANAKVLALARAAIALGRWEDALKALSNNKAYRLQVLLDNLFSGAAASGRSNWVWQDLPRAYMAARAMLELKRRDDARAAFDRLLKVPELVANGEIHWLSLYDRGRIAEEDGKDAEAIGLYRRAVDVIELQRATIQTEANKIGFIGNRQDVYNRLVRLLIRQGNASEALEVAERAKSRALVDLLASRLRSPAAVYAEPHAGPALAAFFEREADSRLQAPLAQGTSGGGDRWVRLQTAATQLREAAPQLASLLTVDRLSLRDIQQLVHPDEALLQFYIAGDDGHVFVLTDAGVRVAAFDARKLEDRVRQLRRAMERRAGTVPASLQELYRLLLKDALTDVRAPNLLVVPHGPLHYLPFAALHDGSRYLVERYAIRQAPTASVLRYLAPRGGVPSMLLMGNPDLDNPDNDLPHAQQEVEALSRQVANSVLLLRKAASETAFRERAGRFRQVHIASHGIFNDTRPLDSALMLARDERNDGLLTAAELYNLRLNIDLLTLSACETGVGRTLNGDEVIGLTRAFLYAGAVSIIASLWNVDDEATALMMQEFYRQLITSDKRQALRRAQQAMRARFDHPYFWGGFFLVGNDK